MGYDIKIHLGQQMENFLTAFANADVVAMERIKGIIMDIFKNTDEESILLSVHNWDKKRQDEIQKVWNKALETVKTIAGAKKNEELLIDLDVMKRDTVQALNELENDYWVSIRGLFLKNVKE